MTDSDARQLAQREFDKPLVFEAGAGTGKTTVLVNRVVCWCLGRGWIEATERQEQRETSTPDRVAGTVLDSVLAITFTEAAAGEMANRLAQALADIAAGRFERVVGFDRKLIEPPLTDQLLQERARILIGSLDRLAIRTIHSHCWHLLATYSLAAGVSTDLRVDADGRILEEIAREMIEESMKSAYEGRLDDPLVHLAEWTIGPKKILETLLELVQKGLTAADLASDPLGHSQRNAIRHQWIESFAQLRDRIEPLASLKGNALAPRIAARIPEILDHLEGSPTEPDLAELAALRTPAVALWEDFKDHLKKWSKGRFGLTEDKALGDKRDALRRCAARLCDLLEVHSRLDPVLFDMGRRALFSLLGEIETRLVARGYETYNTLLYRAVRVLKDQPQLADSERQKLRLLLVDEFQDTDPQQCELVRILALDGKAADRPALFVVGDPKQSIYGWRDADLLAYEGFVDQVVAAGGERVSLTTNFRSAAPILAEVDRVIDPVMEAEPGLQPTFEPLEPSPELADNPGFVRANRAPIEYWSACNLDHRDGTMQFERTNADEAARIEAAAVARDICRLHVDEGVAWNHFGLLLRKTSRLDTFLEAFRQAQVPFVVGRGKHYFQRREVIDAAALVRAVVDPVDHLALLTYLRSCPVGVPDAALLPLWQREFPALVTELAKPDAEALNALRTIIDEAAAATPTDVPGIDRLKNWPASLVVALENLAFLRQSFQMEPSDRFLEQLRRVTLQEVSEAARYLGPYRLANLERFFWRLQASLDEQGGDAQAVLRALRAGVARATEEDEGTPEGVAEDAVQVLTIHGAKGLEFHHVYLPQLHAFPPADSWPDSAFDTRRETAKPSQYILFGCPTPGYSEVRTRQRAIANAERVRTLYVAMTRARERLVLVGKWPETMTKIDQRTDLYLLRERPGLPESLGELLASTQGEENSFVDHEGVRWRFPLQKVGDTADSRDGSVTADLPDKKRIAAQTRTLVQARQKARVIMQRRFAAAASAEAAYRLQRLQTEETSNEVALGARDEALAVGESFHRVLEIWNVEADPIEELQRQRQAGLDRLFRLVDPTRVERARQRFEELAVRFAQGQLFERWCEVVPHIVAREVPVVLPPGEADEPPVGFVSGSIDLLYRDPDTAELVIVDYKTDQVERDEDIAARADAYRHQEQTYARAVTESLQLDRHPQCQLWFIWPDRLWEDPRTEAS